MSDTPVIRGIRLTRFDVFALLGLLLLVAAVFGRTVTFEFVNYDDPKYVVDSVPLDAGFTWEGLWEATTTFKLGNWMPVTWLSFMLDARVFGRGPAGFHLMNVVWHAANACLVYWWLRSWTGQFWPALWVAAVFAIHPLHVESVAWVSERKDVLKTFFGLLAILFYGGYVHGSRWGYRLSVASLALSLMAKPMLVTLPFVLLLLDVWPLNRFPFTARGAARRVLEKWPYFALSAAACVIAVNAQQSAGALYEWEQIPLGVRLMGVVAGYCLYLGKTFWPTHLSILYPLSMRNWSGAALLGAALLLLSLSVAAVVLGRRRPALAVGWFWFLGTLVPVIGLVQVGSQSIADRYMYVPMIGLSLCLAWGLDWTRTRTARVAAALLGTATILGMLPFSVREVGYWQNSVTLFEKALAAGTDGVTIRQNLGMGLLDAGRYREAAEQLEKAETLDVNHSAGSMLSFNRALAVQLSGNAEQAERLYREVLRKYPNNPLTHVNLGSLLAERGQLAEAEDHFRAALRAQPRLLQARFYLALALARRGQAQSSRHELQQLLTEAPEHGQALKLLNELDHGQQRP